MGRGHVFSNDLPDMFREGAKSDSHSARKRSAAVVVAFIRVEDLFGDEQSFAADWEFEGDVGADDPGTGRHEVRAARRKAVTPHGLFPARREGARAPLFRRAALDPPRARERG